jgi:SAM-dependent methyltransferase
VNRPSWAPPEVDITVPSIARVYDYWIGGTHNFHADREVAAKVALADPSLPKTFRANRAFLRRAVRELMGLGIRQFLDIGSGIPAEGNVHDIAFAADPGCRVLYVDIDPVAVAHGRALLSGEQRAASIQGDLYKPAEILGTPEVGTLLDFSRPIAVILAAVLHFVPDGDDPLALIHQFTDRLVPGSFLVLSHAGTEHVPQAAPSETQSYRGQVSDVIWRSRTEVEALFDGLDLIEPGVVPAPLWRPDTAGDPEGLGASAPMLVGVACKHA